MNQFICPHCRAQYRTSNPEHAGKTTKCKQCGNQFQIPDVRRSAPNWPILLRECQNKIGAPPRTFDEKTQNYLSLEGGWIASILFFFAMCRLIKNSRQRKIFRNGIVVWAHIIQANGVLFSPSQIAGPENPEDDDAPGELVFSVDPSGKFGLAQLAPLAAQLQSLRGTNSNNPQYKKIGDYLEAETVRAFGWPVPQELSPSGPCFISTTMFVRKHLPGGYLKKEFFPIVVESKAPYFAMPLPEKFWSVDLLKWWHNGG